MNAKVGAHEFHHTFTLRHVVTTCTPEMRVWVAPLEREPRYGRIVSIDSAALFRRSEHVTSTMSSESLP